MSPTLLQASAASFVLLSIGHTVLFPNLRTPEPQNPLMNHIDCYIDQGQTMDSRPKIQSYRRHEPVGLWDSGVVPGALNIGLVSCQYQSRLFCFILTVLLGFY